jgi:hypothetical protein
MEFALLAGLVLSLSLNAFQHFKKIKAPKQYSYEALELVNDLTRTGTAVVKITRIDPQSIFLRSPRDL